MKSNGHIPTSASGNFLFKTSQPKKPLPEMSDDERKRGATPEGEPQAPKRQNRGNFATRDRNECLSKIAPYRELTKDSRAANPAKVTWQMGEGRSAGELVCVNTETGRPTCILEGYGDGKIFTSDPEKLNVKLSLDETRRWDRDMIDLFRKELPKAIFVNLKALSTAKDGCKALISSKQRKSVEKKAADGSTQEELYEFIWEEIILDESGPHIPIKFWETKEGERKVQLSVTHKNLTPAYENKPLTEADIEKLPSYVQDAARAKLGEGIAYHALPMTGTSGEPVVDVTAAPNWSGTVNFVGKVQFFLGGIKAQKIKWTASKVTGIQVLGFGAGAEAPAAISANSLFND